MHFQRTVLLTCAFADIATTLHSGRFCPIACDTTLNYATFNDTDATLPSKIRSCQSSLRTTSFYLCLDGYCEYDESAVAYIGEQSSWCDEHGGGPLPGYHGLVDRWKADHGQNVSRWSADDAFQWPTLSQVVIPDSSLFERAFTTIEVAFETYDLHFVYGCYMYYFWTGVVLIGVLTRVISLVQELGGHSYQPVGPGASTAAYSILSLPKAWLKRYLSTPAALGDRCSQPYRRGTVPPRLQSLTIFAFVLFNLVFCTCSYHLTDGNIYWPRKSRQLLRFVSDRTGIISLANFPLVWLFGMRNDVLMWLTGWGFGTYNVFHRWAARVATVQAVVHSIGYTAMILDSGGWPSFLDYWAQHYFWNGELATVAMCALLAFSFYGIRRAHYDMFLVTHISLSIAALWTMYYHVEMFPAGEYNIFIWLCLAIWCLDRLLRLSRMLAFDRSLTKKALVSYNASSNLVRMEIDSGGSLLPPKPGTYYYVHVLDDVLYALQSHPFTLSYLSSDLCTTSDTPLSPLNTNLESCRTCPASSGESSEAAALLGASSPESTSNLVFLIRPYDGFTSRLKSHCLVSPKKLRVLVDGPYGQTAPLHRFCNVLFVVGGTGIAVPLSHLARLLQSSRVQSVKIVWAVREHAFLTAVVDDVGGFLRDERVDMTVHVTRDDGPKDHVPAEDLGVRWKTQRPDVRTVVQKAAQDARQQSIAIVACGPARMADLARKASVEMLSRGYRGVEYFEESFKW